MDTTFTDRRGRLWCCSITDTVEVEALRQIGVDLAVLVYRTPAELVRQWRENLQELGALLWLAYEAELLAAGVTPAEFRGDVLIVIGAVPSEYSALSSAPVQHLTDLPG